MDHEKSIKKEVGLLNFIKCPDTHIYKEELDDFNKKY